MSENLGVVITYLLSQQPYCGIGQLLYGHLNLTLLRLKKNSNFDNRDGKTRGRCGRVHAIFFLGCANLLAE